MVDELPVVELVVPAVPVVPVVPPPSVEEVLRPPFDEPMPPVVDPAPPVDVLPAVADLPPEEVLPLVVKALPLVAASPLVEVTPVVATPPLLTDPLETVPLETVLVGVEGLVAVAPPTPDGPPLPASTAEYAGPASEEPEHALAMMRPSAETRRVPFETE